MSLRRIQRYIRCSAPCVFSAFIVVSWTTMLIRTSPPSSKDSSTTRSGGAVGLIVSSIESSGGNRGQKNAPLVLSAPEIRESEAHLIEEAVKDFKRSGDRVVAVDDLGRPWTLDDIKRRTRRRDDDLQFPVAREYPLMSRKSGSAIMFPTSANVSSEHGGRLIYNRVPKCASSTMQVVIDLLSQKNQFEYRSSTSFLASAWTSATELTFLESLYAEESPLFGMDQHLFFIDAFAYGIPEESVPNWINVVREPVERHASLFRYHRHPKRWIGSNKPPKSWFAKDYSDCVFRGDPECQFDPKGDYLAEQQLTYFCGSSQSCQVIGSVEALQAAKYNLEKHYAVVGLAGDLEMSLAVMENYLPRYFSGAASIYSRLPKSEFGQEFRRNEAAVVVANASDAVKAVASAADPSSVLIISKEAHAILRKNMSLEIDFHNFAQQRLLAQHRRTIGTSNSHSAKHRMQNLLRGLG